MALPLLSGALKMLGGGDVAKKLASAGGNILLNKVSEKYGLDMSSPDFDKEAAEAMLADKVESNKLIVDMRAHEVEETKARLLDVQDARKQEQFADLVKLLAIGLSVIYVIVMGCLFFLANDKLEPWAEANLNQMISVLNNLLIATWAFFFGSSVGSKQKSAQQAEDEKRDDILESQKSRVVEQVSTQRPIHQPTEPQPTEPDELDNILHKSISTTRPTSAGDSLL